MALLGTLNLDLLLHGSLTDPRSILATGGLCYSLAALARLRPRARLLPVAWLAAEDAPHFQPVLERAGADRAGLAPCPGPGNRVRLDCRAPDKREWAELILPPLGSAELEPALDCPRLLLNCCSGRDVERGTWRAFRAHWRRRHPAGWLQLDWHSLSLDWEPGRARRLRRVPQAFSWLEDLDLLQLTLAETASLSGKPPHRLEDAADLVLGLRRAGCRRVVVTDGARGCLFADKQGVRRQAAWPVAEVRDTTGCGDVLGAALLATLGFGWPAERALPWAARAAGEVCAGVGLGSLDVLQAIDEAETTNGHE